MMQLLFSLIWRVQISSSFKNIFLPKNVEEDLRCFLNKKLKDTQQLLMNTINDSKLDYDNYIIKPINKSRGVFTAYSIDENTHSIFLINFMCIFKSKTEKNEIPLVDENSWANLNREIVNQIKIS